MDVRGVLGVPGTSRSVSSMLSLHETALSGKGFLITIELSSSSSYIFNFAHWFDNPFMIDNLSAVDRSILGTCSDSEDQVSGSGLG